MSATVCRTSTPWFAQAESDVRTAEALLSSPQPMRSGDIGCHVAALCAQAIEKSLKGYLLLNGVNPALTHRPDKYLSSLLTSGSLLLSYPDQRGRLSALFDPKTRRAVRTLLDLTPGTLGRNDVPNTEYPWLQAGDWKHLPAGASVFASPASHRDWLATAKRVVGTLRQFWIAVDRSTF